VRRRRRKKEREGMMKISGRERKQKQNTTEQNALTI
jgi:hypothetical protein